MPGSISKEAVLAIYRPFAKAGQARVWLSTCCQKVYVGAGPAQKCKTCPKEPVNTEVASEKEVELWVEKQTKGA